MDNAVALVHVNIFHSKVSPLTKKLVELLAALRFGNVQRNDLGCWLNLEYTRKPILVGQ